MTFEEQVELANLTNMLNDQFICIRLKKTEKLDHMLRRYTELIDKFLQTYELPENSDNCSLKN